MDAAVIFAVSVLYGPTFLKCIPHSLSSLSRMQNRKSKALSKTSEVEGRRKVSFGDQKDQEHQGNERDADRPASMGAGRLSFSHLSAASTESLSSSGSQSPSAAFGPPRLRLDSSNQSPSLDAGWGHFDDSEFPPSSAVPPPAAPVDTSPSTVANGRVPQHHNKSRAAYNKHIMPRRVILIRHGQSEGNVNEEIYATKPDPDLLLTPSGWKQARSSGRALKEGCGSRWSGIPVGKESIHFVVSPYARTVETFHGVLDAFVPASNYKHIKDEGERMQAWYAELRRLGITWHEDPRIREQDFGNYQHPEHMKQYKRDRHRYGAFYYRFPHGESASDVYDRVSTFLDSLWRSFEAQKADNYVIVTHGASIRVLLTRYFRYSVDEYNRLSNPCNGEMVLLAHDGHGKLELRGRIQLKEPSGQEDEEKETECYEFHSTLRTRPVTHTRLRTVRMSDEL
ncbi:hypothetical protein TrST_g11413 [Triparma strigata]|uniref:Phosphoglycerate mutase n=1 Tax=Triparma strigata TaxID=1606541 RepID=A0A9W7EHE5_9STRA|nr:hypothetical protein TrST_g11413 [Triparma strigata]